jgi:hypothetical protein
MPDIDQEILNAVRDLPGIAILGRAQWSISESYRVA